MMKPTSVTAGMS